MQLLGGLTFTELHLRATASVTAQFDAEADHEEAAFDWLELSQAGRPLVKLVNRQGDTPLILVHGASGSVVSFMPLQQKFTSYLWALQSTPDMPMHSLDAMAAYYYKAIKDAQPNGPYRIGAYSGTSIIAILIAERIVNDGDVAGQFSLLDHSPPLFTSPYFAPDDATVRLRTPSHAFINRVMQSMLCMYSAEPSMPRRQLADEFEDAASGKVMPPAAALRWRIFSSLVTGTYEFTMFELLRQDVPYSQDLLRHALATRLRTVRVPLTLFVADRGILLGLRSAADNVRHSDWSELGTREVYPNANVVIVEGTHFTMLDSTVLTDGLQRG
ncbi:hypothetical protein FOMPIDRAFT_1128805 [Fomitopsis schrenkii]|uniref:Thioesterase domain-containing protein n=1 Tax=Fomitopsis schrenkii TaxID=2126942 RepID=S8E1Q9_FOMSC|nr:hypothetical protein FOMPIDRAFT_1128745 [Fomitopsis schrenkii]EPS97321.1 hypothetical protein FOMPIDRAFT_1128805 [Fomitopsis schrenkii]